MTENRDGELSEIGQLFRRKLAWLREQERTGAPRTRRFLRPTIRLPEEQPDDDAILRIGEAAALLGVSPRALARWAAAGYLPCLRTIGGHRRFRWRDVRAAAEKPAPSAPERRKAHTLDA